MYNVHCTLYSVHCTYIIYICIHILYNVSALPHLTCVEIWGNTYKFKKIYIKLQTMYLK